MQWFDKNFHSLNYFLRTEFGCKVIKISIDGGFTCPNRDGTLSAEGCIFCSGRGSGDFAFDSGLPIEEQFYAYRQSLMKKWPNAKYIPYFQAYTNTYGAPEMLKHKYETALLLPDVVGLSVATRPDCLGGGVLKVLEGVKKAAYLFVELGFQSAKPETVQAINRCYDNPVFDSAVKDLKSIGANVVAHIILGLPGESKADMLNTVRYVVDRGVSGIKFHLLYIMKGTRLAALYQEGRVKEMAAGDYIDALVSAIEIVPADIIIHRLTGDAPREELVAPLYSIKKFQLLNAIDAEFLRRGSWQGKYC